MPLLQQTRHFRVKRFPDENAFCRLSVRQVELQYSGHIFNIFNFGVRYGDKSIFCFEQIDGFVFYPSPRKGIVQRLKKSSSLMGFSKYLAACTR